MSELLDAAIKAGDKIYFRGEKVESIEITRDKDEPPLKVDLAHTRASYLDTITEQLNENQQKWINRLTINYSWYGGTAQHALHATLQEPEMPDLPQNEFAQVLEVFSKWVQEQGEE